MPKTTQETQQRLIAVEVTKRRYGERLVRVKVRKPHQDEPQDILVRYDDYLMIVGQRPDGSDLASVAVPLQERLTDALFVLADRKPSGEETPPVRRLLSPYPLESLLIDGNEDLRDLAAQFISRICAAWLELLPPEDRLRLETDWLEVLFLTQRHPAPGASHLSQATVSPYPAATVPAK